MTKRSISRRLVLGAGATAPLAFARGAWSQEKTIQVGVWGGTQGEFIRKSPSENSFMNCRVFWS